MSTVPLIDIRNLVYDYPGFRALKGLNARIERGSVTALVGPNGAGKTTLLRCIAALETPVSGAIHIGELDVHENPRNAHKLMGYLSDAFGVYQDLSVKQALTYAARSRGISSEAARTAVLETTEKVQLTEKLEAKAGTLSRGQRQRLAIGQAIVHTPQILLLDEPANGLDPEARSSLAKVFTGLSREGMTLLVSSHILAELDEYSTHMLALDQGKVLEHRPLNTIATAGQSGPVWHRLTFPSRQSVGPALAWLSSQDAVNDVAVEGASMIFHHHGDAQDLAALVAGLVGAGLPFIELKRHSENLQESYLRSLDRQRARQAETPPQPAAEETP
ncbi:ABC transporter ATP-binding protein [Hydrogenophaga sp. 5NK40-0174]|uniref:ABC transporter ATP-binding protein n=1 Tax=Hydrogenophaga sp. 5NK40-0174 TaxID=3127649 RepID=UPI0031027C0C